MGIYKRLFRQSSLMHHTVLGVLYPVLLFEFCGYCQITAKVKLVDLQLGAVVWMAVCRTEILPTPRVQCHTRKDADILERILQTINQGNKITGVIKLGAVVYVHLADEKLG